MPSRGFFVSSFKPNNTGTRLNSSINTNNINTSSRKMMVTNSSMNPSRSSGTPTTTTSIVSMLYRFSFVFLAIGCIVGTTFYMKVLRKLADDNNSASTTRVFSVSMDNTMMLRNDDDNNKKQSQHVRSPLSTDKYDKDSNVKNRRSNNFPQQVFWDGTPVDLAWDTLGGVVDAGKRGHRYHVKDSEDHYMKTKNKLLLKINDNSNISKERNNNSIRGGTKTKATRRFQEDAEMIAAAKVDDAATVNADGGTALTNIDPDLSKMIFEFRQSLKDAFEERKRRQKQQILVLTLLQGDAGIAGKQIKISLYPELSNESIEYVQELSKQKVCGGDSETCKFRRAESSGGIFQGIMASGDNDDGTRRRIPIPQVKGPCPKAFEKLSTKGGTGECHGPIMTKGMVGWVGGATGPEFFITTDERPATWWGTRHTVWGEIQDADSFAVLEKLASLPTTKPEGQVLAYLQDPVPFKLKVINSDKK